MDIFGSCDDKFSAVRDAFRANFAQHDELGASVAIWYDGRLVVDLWGGFLDEARQRRWPHDGIVNVWSVGKAMTALAVLKLIDAGNLDVDQPVASYWPEFAQAGKERISVGELLAHQAGLPGLAAPLPAGSYFQWHTMTDALAAQPPWWQPGSAHGYHTNTFSFLNGEVLRRVTGRRLRDYFREEVTTKLGVDFFMGFGAEEFKRCADLAWPTPAAAFAQARAQQSKTEARPDPDAARWEQMRSTISSNPPMDAQGPRGVNSAAWRAAEFPSTNPHSNARSVATIFGQLADVMANNRRHEALPGPDSLRLATAIRSDGDDLVVGRPTRFGLGFQLTQPDRPLGPNQHTFGHYGNGGHLGFADPTVPLGFAYHMNLQGFAWRDPRNIALTDAVYASVD